MWRYVCNYTPRREGVWGGGGGGIASHIFNLGTNRGEWQTTCPGRFNPGGNLSSVYWRGPRACLDTVMKKGNLCLLPESNFLLLIDAMRDALLLQWRVYGYGLLSLPYGTCVNSVRLGERSVWLLRTILLIENTHASIPFVSSLKSLWAENTVIHSVEKIRNYEWEYLCHI
jgi:hypothetical protein